MPDQVLVFDPTDHLLESRLKKALDDVVETPFELRILPSPSFMLKHTEVRDYFAEKSQHNFADFYQWQRERFNILIDKKYKPVGGKWNHEIDSTKLPPADHATPGFNGFGDSKYVAEAVKWVEKHFTGNPGNLDNFFWPTNHTEAEKWLNEFLHERLENFATYEDAIEGHETFLYHSGISAPLNIGLLTPAQVVDAALAYHEKAPVNLPSLEGFIKQIIGWREYVRGLYITQQVSLRSSNTGQIRNLNNQWYDATTGIPPLDDVIAKVNTNAYAQNIERLMVVGNLMMLCEIKAEEVYKWYAGMFIDAYDWVVVPNVYGMNQLNDLGGMVDKPYISASSYILNLSNYKKDIWCDIWDGLYWGFVDKHKDVLVKILVPALRYINLPRLAPIGDALSATERKTF